MGYRSQVALAVSKKEVGRFMAALAGCEEARMMVFEHYDHLETDYRQGGILVTWDYIKWYDDYKGVNSLDQFMDDMDTEDLEEEYRFCRTGEDYDDIVDRGCMEGFHISVNIDFY